MTEVVRSVGDAADVADEWRALTVETGASPFHGPDFFQAWEAFAPGRLRYLLARRDGELVGVLPLVVAGRTVRAAANVHSPSYAPVVRDARAAEELVGALVGLRPRRVRLEALVGDDQAVTWFRQALTAQFPRHRANVEVASPYLDVWGSLSEFEAKQHPDRRKQLRRSRRRATEQGGLVLETETGAKAVETFLGDGLAVEASGWKGRQGTAIVCSTETLAFYTSLVRWAARDDLLRVFTARLAGRLIAFEMAIETADEIYMVKRGFDETHRPLTPGFLLDQETARHAFDSSTLRRMHHLGGLDHYKIEISSGVLDRVTLEVYPGGVTCRIREHGDVWRQDLRGRLKDAVPATALPTVRRARTKARGVNPTAAASVEAVVPVVQAG